MTALPRNDDLGELSPTVASALAAAPAEVTAVELARDIFGRHPEYGGQRVKGLRLGASGTATRRHRRTWLADVRALYDRATAPLLHGRLVVIGLAQLEPALRAALDADGFYDALVSELAEPIGTLWAQPAPTSEPDQLWSRLSLSSKDAVARASRLSSGNRVHTEHLVLGLYNRPDGPTRRFLDDSGVTRDRLGTALAKAGEVHPTDPGPPTELDALPPVSRHVAQALQHAEAFADELRSPTVRSRHLFYGVLALENCDVTRALADLDVTAARFRAWLQDQSPQQVERRVLTGGLSPDLVDPDQGIPREQDDLGVSTYVAMMATAIAGTDTKLPLSIGLFGGWGSGKSYFMGLLRKQVEEVASSSDPAYCSGIVQIGFNAWSYADANLWASLGDEIFRELAGPTDDKQESQDSKERREQLRTWLADEQGRVKELGAAKDAAATEVAKLRAELDERECQHRTSAVTLLRATLAAVKADEQQAAELRSAWKKLGLDDETEQARLLADAVTGTRDAVSAVRRTAVRGNRRYLVAAILASCLLLVVVGLASSGVLAPWLTGTGLGTLLAAGVAFATATKRMADGARRVADLANQIRHRTQAGDNKQVQAALAEVRAAEAREQVLQAQLDQVVARVGELGRELVELSPGQRLYAFLAERAASEDYRRQLGLIATIRRDFECLARLQEQWRKDTGGGSPRPIDRIVLYIDDLDRCTPRQVVDVLQAVHLLLALDLFVVVVGVDPRWLLHSLRDQYRSTLTAPPPGVGTAGSAEGIATEASRGRDDGTVREDTDRLMLSTPQDYLEKIFNVPFVLPGMTPSGFEAMIRRLSITEPDGDREATPGREGQASDASPVSSNTGTTVVTGTEAAPRVQKGSEIAAVQHGNTVVPTPLTEPELQVLSSLAPLVRSPREAKRLLNLYRMLRSTQDLSDASRFLGADGAEGEFQSVAMLLGLLTATPRLLGQILFALPDPEQRLLGGICHRAAQGTWGAFLDGLRPRRVGERWCNDLRDDLSEDDRAEWQLLVERTRPASELVKLPDLTTFATWAPHVARFSFLLAPITGEGAASGTD